MTEELRVCKACGIEKAITSFPKWKQWRKYVCHTCRSQQHEAKHPGSQLERAKKSVQKYRANKPALKRQLMDALGQHVCQDCGAESQLHYHHRDKSTKEFGINYGLQHTYTFDTLLAEARKCDLICNKCHQARHQNDHSQYGKDKGRDEFGRFKK